MHRSGTSAIAGYLDSLGVSGGQSLMEGAYDNPLGFYENKIINKLNNEILVYNGTHWSDVLHVNFTWNESHLNQAKKAISDQFLDKSIIYIKDPQVSLLLEFWTEVLASLGFQICHLLVIRHPSEIINSLNHRNNLSEEKSEALIMKYWLSVLSCLRNKKFLVIDYNELVNNQDQILKQIEILYNWKPNNEKLTNKSFINKALRNNKQIISDVESDNYLHNLYVSLYEYDFINGDSFGKIDQYIDNPPRINFNSIRDKESTEANFAKIFYDTGNGFSEKESRFVLHDGLLLRSTISFDSKPIHRIKIVPIHRDCQIKINSVQFLHNDLLLNYKFNHNGRITETAELLRYEDSPSMMFTFNRPQLIDKALLDFEFIFIESKTSKVGKGDESVNTKLDLFWSSIKLFISSPFSFVRHINTQNLRTLKSALKRENPQTIFKNIKKLIFSKSLNQSSFNKNSQGQALDASDLDEASSVNVVMYVCGVLPEFDKSSGAQRAHKICSIISNCCRLIIVCNKIINDKYVDHYMSQGIEIVLLDRLKKRFGQIAPNVITIIFNKYYTYDDYNYILNWFSTSKTIIDAEDIAWKREQGSAGYTKLSLSDISKNKQRELRSYAAVDHIWCVTQADLRNLKIELPEAPISIVSNIHEKKNRHPKNKSSHSILFFANYNHEPNVTALKELLNVIFPLIKEHMPDARLTIAGSSIAEVQDLIPDDPYIDVVGYIEHSAIPALYSNASVVIVPLKFGSGIKGKITEAIMHDVPVITNAIGNEGINLEDKISGFITERSDVMAQYAVDILYGKYDVTTISDRAYKKIEKLVSYDINRQSIVNSIFKKVSICIVTYNQMDLLRDCINSILDNTSYPNYEILVYSNGCTDGTQDYLVQLSERYTIVDIVLSDENKVYVEPNNILMKKAGRNDVVLVNNDVVVKANWLSHLSHTARLNKDCGIVGAKILYPNGMLQEYGSEIYVDGTGANLGKHDDPNKIEYHKVISASYVSGCCMYIKRNTIDIIGMFDTKFIPCYFEDSDYCYTAWKSNIQTLVSPKSSVIHKEGSSAGNDETIGFKKYQAINRKKFLKKHGKNIDLINKKARKQSLYYNSVL